MRAHLLSAAVLFSIILTSTDGLSDDKTVRFHGTGSSPVVTLTARNSAIPPPDSILGYALGERPARQAHVLEYFRTLEKSSPRLRLFRMGQTYEGRPLVYAVISSEANIARLDAIKQNLASIADPRTLREGDLEATIKNTPACLWFGYSIHGDEISGVDASMAVGYHLVAGEDSLSRSIRDNLIIIIDPMQNPDGRERYLAQMESFASAVPHGDGQSLQKGGFWPWGRGNHYLFDMNRDWFAQELPESKARISAMVEWHPQLVVDAHEMGQWDTYLFSPPRAPFNLQITDRIKAWWDTFAADQARAFDRRGWAYYTREWNEEWYPGYGSSWPLYTGAVGILYEQAGVSGRLARHDGTVMTYAETVEHQYVSSMANISTALAHRKQLLTDYYQHRAKAIADHGGSKVKAFLVRAGTDHADHLAETLIRQGIEVGVAQKSFSSTVRNYFASSTSRREFGPGTLVIRTGQPQGFLVQTILGFDPRLPDSFLVTERRELLKNRDSRLYEVTSWSMLQAYGLDAYESDQDVSVQTNPWSRQQKRGGVDVMEPAQGFLFDASTEDGLSAAASLLSRGIIVQAAKKDLDVDGKRFSRGSIFVPARANQPGYGRIVDTVAREFGITVSGVRGGKGVTGPDLGGSELELLRKPRVALVAGGATSFTSVGWIWHLLDQKLGIPVSLVDVAQLGSLDLSVYNVIILPGGGGFGNAIGKPTVQNLRSWVRDGGVLIAMDRSAEFCADSSNGLSGARPRSQVLGRLAEFNQSVSDEIAAETPDIRALRIWDYSEKDTVASKERKMPSAVDVERAEELGSLFSPFGAILRVDLDREHWLSFGLGDRIPVMVSSSTVLMAKHPGVRTVGRFSAAKDLRVSGLLWPEARVRLALSSHCTWERSGRGCVILFASQPNFRSYFRGAERLLANAVVFGPGLGTSWTPEW